MIYVNKMDMCEKAEDEILQDIREHLTAGAVASGKLIQSVGKGLAGSEENIEASGASLEEIKEEIASLSETTIETFLETGDISTESITGLLYGNVYHPVLFGSALKNMGTENLVSFITAYIKDFNFNSDGRYTLDITETDLAGNAEEKAYHSGTFVIDTTAPKASISVSKVGGGTVRTGDDAYVDSDVSVNVIVDEVNFDPDSTEITINGNAFNPGSWSGGSSHTAVIPASNFAKDGQYTISISGKDLAGNTLKPVTSSFTVDKKKPEIKITGVSSANNGDVSRFTRMASSFLLLLKRTEMLSAMTWQTASASQVNGLSTITKRASRKR